MSYDIGVIIPVYRATPALPALLRELDDVLRGKAYHVFIVDDSAEAQTHAFLERECMFHTVTCIRLMDNVGQQNALLCGIRAAAPYCGRLVTIDDDGQHDLTILPQILKRLPDENGFVCALPIEYHKGWRAWGSRARDMLFCTLLHLPRGKRVSSYRAFTSDLAQKLAAWQGTFFYLSAVAIAQSPHFYNVTYPARVRVFGKSGYTLKKLLTLWMRIAIHYRRDVKQPSAPPPYEIACTKEGTKSF